MRVAVVDIGTNSTRLLVAEVDPADGVLRELVRRSVVTRLGERVDSGGSLSPEAIARVRSTLDEYRAMIEDQGAEANLALLTSAVRDATNGASFTEMVRETYHLDARVLSGDEEAQLTFTGAMSDRAEGFIGDPTVVIDIGGGSTEFVVGSHRKADFHTSLQAGVVRMGERHIHSDPPTRNELEALAEETRSIFRDGLPAAWRSSVSRGIAVAGTATAAAAIAQELDPYDPDRVHGYELTLLAVDRLRERLAALDEPHRRLVTGLQPGRAPTIVPGMILLREAISAFGLDRIEVSEHDILRGGALSLADAA